MLGVCAPLFGPGLKTLRDWDVRLAVLSNGEPRMLGAAARSAGINTQR